MLFYLFVDHFFDKHYAATSYGDRFSSVPLQLNFCASASCLASNLTQPWRIYPGQPPPSDHQPRILRNQAHKWNLHRGTSPVLHPFRAILSLGQKWSPHRARLKAQRLCPIRLIFIIADHATQSTQSILLPSISTLATEIAANFGPTK